MLAAASVVFLCFGMLARVYLYFISAARSHIFIKMCEVEGGIKICYVIP